MRMSCNGCRILRKGCSDDCVIKPCLDWISSPDSQANATLFLAKFYGRAGLINLIEAGPNTLRPAIFKSLLYEACGRIVDPVSGAVGLLWSGNWAKCQGAVDSVLSTGSPLPGNNLPAFPPSLSSSSSSSSAFLSYGTPALHPIVPPLKTYDIRHVSKSVPASGLDKTSKTRFKRSGTGNRNKLKAPAEEESAATEFSGVLSQQDSWLTRLGKPDQMMSREDESALSVNTVECSGMNRCKPGQAPKFDERNDIGEVGLELTLSLGPRK